VYLAVTGDTILATQHNSPLEDIATALTGSLPRNATAGMLGDLPMGGFKAKNMADGVADSDAATVGQTSGLVSTVISGASTKATPVDADSIVLVDSADSNAIKRVTWAVIKTFLQPISAVLTALSGIGTAVAGDTIYSNGAGTWARLGKGTAGQLLRMNSGATAPEWGAGNGAPDAVLEDQKTSGTNGGNGVSTTWTTRDLNTEVRDPFSLMALSTNQFTPSANGWVEWSTPVYATQMASRLQNITDGTTVAMGVAARADSSPNTGATSSGGGSVVSGKAYAIQYYLSSSGTNRLGLASSQGTEVYTRVKYWRT
jgi:hypothetical protein